MIRRVNTPESLKIFKIILQSQEIDEYLNIADKNLSM